LLEAALEDKELARAEFEAGQAGARDLARARLDAARTWLQTRFQQYLAGRATLDMVEKAAAAMRDAELALATGPADRQAARERYWVVAHAMDVIVMAQYQAGRASLADWAVSHGARLEAEARLAEALWDLGRPSLPRTDVSFPGLEDWMIPVLPVARDLFEAERADPGQRARDRLEWARSGLKDRWRQYLAGRATLDILLEMALPLQEARLAAPAPDRRAALYERWELAHAAEESVRAKYEKGRASSGDNAQTRFHRLDAAEALAKAGGRREQPFSSPADRPIPLGEDDEESKRQAQAWFEDAAAGVSELEQTRSDAAREACQFCCEQYRCGRGTLDYLLETLGELLAAHLAVLDKPADRLAVLDRHRTRTRLIEQILQGQYEAGRAGLAELMQARVARLEAEIRLADARGAAGRE
jgi:hypothetical protein